MDRGEQVAAQRDSWQQPDDDRIDAPRYRRDAGAIDDQHVDVDKDFDQHERGIEGPVRKKQQSYRNGERRESIAQRAVNEGREKGDADQRESANACFHSLLLPTLARIVSSACITSANPSQ